MAHLWVISGDAGSAPDDLIAGFSSEGLSSLIRSRLVTDWHVDWADAYAEDGKVIATALVRMPQPPNAKAMAHDMDKAFGLPKGTVSVHLLMSQQAQTSHRLAA